MMLVREYADRDGVRSRAEITIGARKDAVESTATVMLDVDGDVFSSDVHGIDDVQAMELALSLLRTLELNEGLRLS